MYKYYYPRTIKTITAALLDMFNDIVVVKYDANDEMIEELPVPITFGPVEKYHQDRMENHYFDHNNQEHNNRYYLQIPRLALIPNGVVYDPDRATGVNEWREWMREQLGIAEENIDEVLRDYQPTPYNFNYTLYIKNDSMDYMSQILENILPYFNPTLMLRVKEFSFLNIERDIPVSIDAVGYEFIEDQQSTDTRYVNATMNLTVKGYMYRPFVYSKVIKFINSKYINKSTGMELERYTTSGVATNGGIPINPDEVPEVGTFITSGTYETDKKEFQFYKNKIEIK